MSDDVNQELSPPKLFLSYSWSNQQHIEWVINLAQELVANGVDVTFDKWDLREGQDANEFMEKMVIDPGITKVIIICDRIYSEKANSRKGGVGTETQIISPAIYQKTDQTKFVAVLSEKDDVGNPYLPVYYKSRIYIDLSNDELYASNFEQLLRWIYNKPLYIKPPLGKSPSFVSEENTIFLGTTTQSKKALEAIKSNKQYAKGAIEEYFSTFLGNFESFRITYIKDEIDTFDDKVIDNIEKFTPYRNELITLFSTIAQYGNSDELIPLIHRFFENLIPFMYSQKGVTGYRDWDCDNFKFIINELFLYAITCFLKYESFSSVAHLLHIHYYIEKNLEFSKNGMVPFPVFSNYLTSLDYRNKRLKLGRLSIQADQLIQRCKGSGFTDSQLMQSDFLLFIADALYALKNSTYQNWQPFTLIYSEDRSGPYEIFARAQSTNYFNQIKPILGIDKKADIISLISAFDERKVRIPNGNWGPLFNPSILMGFEKMATL
jgi:hypothetical protein